MRIAVMLHLYYHDLWEEFSPALRQLGNHPFDLYVSLSEGSETLCRQEAMKQKIREEYPGSQIFIAPNQGLDIGPFLRIVSMLMRSEVTYDLLLKLHTKKSIVSCGAEAGLRWRRELYVPLLQHAGQILDAMRQNTAIGMIGSSQHLYTFEGVNAPVIRELENLLGIRSQAQGIFVGGTMFWMRYPILERYLDPERIEELLAKLEAGYFTDAFTPSYTHAMERILGYMVTDQRLAIAGI